MHYLALCAIVKDETPYLKEWIEYHVLVGVERFIIYDNDSAEPVEQTLADYLFDDFITVVKVSGKEKQVPCYTHCLENFGHRFRWIGFLDLDEFAVPKDTGDLRLLLTDYEDYGGLGVNWATFGSSGRLTRPPGLVTENYTLRMEHDYGDNTHIKSFVRPDRAEKGFNAHSFIYKPGYFCVNENHVPVSQGHSPHSVKRVQINHYFTRSQQDYCFKLERGRADITAEAHRHRMDAFYDQADKATVPDKSIFKHLKQLKLLSAKNNPRLFFEIADKYTQKRELFEYTNEIPNLVRNKRFTEAKKILCAASLYYDDIIEFNLFCSALHRLAGEYDRALRYTLKALSIGPSLDANFELFLVRLKTGKIEEAESIYKFMRHMLKIKGESDDWREKMGMARDMLETCRQN